MQSKIRKIDNKNVLLGFIGFLAMITATLLFTTQDAVGADELVPFTKLTDADIDMIIAVQEKMAAAREARLAGMQDPAATP